MASNNIAGSFAPRHASGFSKINGKEADPQRKGGARRRPAQKQESQSSSEQWGQWNDRKNQQNDSWDRSNNKWHNNSWDNKWNNNSWDSWKNSSWQADGADRRYEDSIDTEDEDDAENHSEEVPAAHSGQDTPQWIKRALVNTKSVPIRDLTPASEGDKKNAMMQGTQAANWIKMGGMDQKAWSRAIGEHIIRVLKKMAHGSSADYTARCVIFKKQAQLQFPNPKSKLFVKHISELKGHTSKVVDGEESYEDGDCMADGEEGSSEAQLDDVELIEKQFQDLLELTEQSGVCTKLKALPKPCGDCTYCQWRANVYEIARDEVSELNWSWVRNDILSSGQLSSHFASHITMTRDALCKSITPSVKLLYARLVFVSPEDSCSALAPELVVHSVAEPRGDVATLTDAGQAFWESNKLQYTIRRWEGESPYGHVLAKGEQLGILLRDNGDASGEHGVEGPTTIEAQVLNSKGDTLWLLSSMEIKWLSGMPVHHLVSAKDYGNDNLTVFTEDEEEEVTPMDRSRPLDELLVVRTDEEKQQRMSKWFRIGGEYFNDESGYPILCLKAEEKHNPKYLSFNGVPPASLILALRKDWVCWRHSFGLPKFPTIADTDGESDASGGDQIPELDEPLPDTEESGGAVYCHICGIWLNAASQAWSHKWAWNSVTNQWVNASKHASKLDSALKAAEKDQVGEEVTYLGRKNRQITTKVNLIYKEFLEMRQGCSIPQYLLVQRQPCQKHATEESQEPECADDIGDDDNGEHTPEQHDDYRENVVDHDYPPPPRMPSWNPPRRVPGDNNLSIPPPGVTTYNNYWNGQEWLMVMVTSQRGPGYCQNMPVTDPTPISYWPPYPQY